MRYLIFLSLFLSQLFGLTLQEAEKQLIEGNRLFGEKNFSAAIQAYQTALTFAPSAHILYNIGQCYASLNQPGFALAYFLKAKKQRPYWALPQKALLSIYKDNVNFVSYENPWYVKLFSLAALSTWEYVGSFCFWGSLVFIVCYFFIRRNKFLFYMGIFAFICCLVITTLILSNRPYFNLYVCPEQTVARFAPSETSPVRYNWGIGTLCRIKAERADFCFVNTLDNEDGWVEKQALISL